MKILLGEDDPITSEIIREQLIQWGYEPICAATGTDAWMVLQDPEGPKLAILDWQMPLMTGLEICQKLRRRQSGTYIYVIMLTSLSGKAHVIQGLEGGADDYITKPCNPQELRVRLMTGQRILSLEAELLYTLKQVRDSGGNEKTSVYDNKLIGRELEILRLVVAGKSYEDIAAAFHLSPDWVIAHMGNIMQKMNVTTRDEAAAKAVQDGFLTQTVSL